MIVLDRLKFELNKKPYFEQDDDYITILEENGLDYFSIYDKANMQKKLLQTVVDVLEIVSNDIDMLRRVETEFLTTESASKNLKIRIQDLKNRIATIPDESEQSTGNITRLFGSRW